MPTYILKNSKTGKTWSEFMSWSELEKLLKAHPTYSLEVSAPAIIDSWHRAQVPSGFRDVLKRIKKKHRGNKITNTGNLTAI